MGQQADLQTATFTANGTIPTSKFRISAITANGSGTLTITAPFYNGVANVVWFTMPIVATSQTFSMHFPEKGVVCIADGQSIIVSLGGLLNATITYGC